MNELKTIQVERPKGKPVKLLSSVTEGIHYPYENEPYIRRASGSGSTAYGTSGGTTCFGHNWYFMKLEEEKELANG